MSKDKKYNFIYGERSSGKTEIMYRLIIDDYIDEDLPSAYILRHDEMIKQGNFETLFNPHISYIIEKTGGKWNFVKYQFHAFWLQKRDPNTGVLLEKDKKPFCRTYTLSTPETTKSIDLDKFKHILYGIK